MVAGFNTEIKRGGVVYHIQTELRKGAGIETAVYVRGKIIHSVKTSHEEFINSPDYTDEKYQQILEDQHRQVISRIRTGEIKAPDATLAGPLHS